MKDGVSIALVANQDSRQSRLAQLENETRERDAAERTARKELATRLSRSRRSRVIHTDNEYGFKSRINR